MPASAAQHLAALRLSAQRIADSDLASPAAVVEWMLAMQAQDFGGARWSVGLRLPGSTDAAIGEALASGDIVRSWPMRGTLHFTVPRDLGWMLDIAARRQATVAARRRSDLGITAAELARAGEVASERLAGGRALRRDLLLTEWQRAGIATDGQRAYHLLWNLGHEKVIVFGPPDGAHPTFALFDEWVRGQRPLAGDEALGEFAARYFRSHGPATVRDFAWWASITLGDARRGVAIATPELQVHELDGVTYYAAPGLEPAAPAIYALPGFDEYILGYQDRSLVLDPAFFPSIVPGGNGIFLPTAVVDGRIVGTWKKQETARAITVDLSTFTAAPKKTHVGFARAIGRYGAFIGKPAELRALPAER